MKSPRKGWRSSNVLLRVRAKDVTLLGDWSPAVSYTLVGDSNANGIPDWWEWQRFGSLQLGNGDFDGDGASDYAEYVADTDPTDPGSYLRIASAQVSTNGVLIGWSGGSRARQYLERISALGGTNVWADLQIFNPPTLSSTNFLDTSGTNSAGFYRISVER